MAGAQQAVPGLVRHGIPQQQIERYPEFSRLRPNGRHGHVGELPTVRRSERLSQHPRLDVATRKVEEIRTIKEFRLTPSNGWGVSWTPDGEPIVLAHLRTWDIYRIDLH